LREHVVGMPYGSIHRWPFYIWPDMICDLSKPWLDAVGSVGKDSFHPPAHGKILINRTSRYQNPFTSYFFLRDHQEDLLFVGMEEEHKEFCKQWGLDIPHHKVNDFWDLANSIYTCRFFIGNQSLCFAIAEGLKTPRLLEVCPYAPNVIPTGQNAYDFQQQFALEFLFNDLKSKF